MHDVGDVQTLELVARYRAVRDRSASACAPLSIEDAAVQSMPDASPAKWHLAHTTWFFEQFVLAPLGVAPHDARYGFLFNSYYEAAGPRHDRARRGLASRPSLEEVRAYRAAVDARVVAAIEAGALDAAARAVLELGLHHEQQHQELILTDVKHALGTQPLRPAYRTELAGRRDLADRPGGAASAPGPAPLDWIELDGGLVELGASPRDFAFDNERPRHRVYIEPFRLARRPLANAEVLAFIAEGGYAEPRLWLADGFAAARREGWEAPLYWRRADGAWLQYTLGGEREVDPAETACHLSYYEADAIARWAGARLPTEQEWEHAAAGRSRREGHWADDDRLHPCPAVGTGAGLQQLFGDVWEWTQSAYAPYPGFRPLGGALGEYNGKFMSGQMVLRGGSCLTPRGHVRASYRNFFPPGARWQMTGARLAADRPGGTR